MDLGIDDSACSVAAAALFYVLATDVSYSDFFYQKCL